MMERLCLSRGSHDGLDSFHTIQLNTRVFSIDGRCFGPLNSRKGVGGELSELLMLLRVSSIGSHLNHQLPPRREAIAMILSKAEISESHTVTGIDRDPRLRP